MSGGSGNSRRGRIAVAKVLRACHGDRQATAGSAMLTLRCPYCDVDADETELASGGEAHLKRAGADADDDAFEAYLFVRQNPKGVHFERWRHAFGCGKWFHAARCTLTNEVFGTYSAQVNEPPRSIRDRIAARRPGASQ